MAKLVKREEADAICFEVKYPSLAVAGELTVDGQVRGRSGEGGPPWLSGWLGGMGAEVSST